MYDCPGLHLEHTPLVSGGHMYIISIYCYAPFFTLKSWVDVVDEGGIPGVQGMPDAPACLPAGLLTEHDSLLALSTWPPSPSWKVLFSFTLFIILYSFLISRPTWQNFTIPSHLTYWSVSQFLQCFYRGLFEAGRWNNIFSFPWILFSLSIPIHREMAALSGENIALMFSPTFHVFNENNSKRNVSCNYIIHSLYPCSIKTREVLINPSPMPKRFPETGENPSFVSRSGNPFLP